MNYLIPVKYAMRIVNISLSSYLSYISFDLFYEKFMTFVPPKESLDQLNKHNVGMSLSPLLRENSAGFRELYYHAYEKSLLFSLVVLITSIILIEYIYRSSRNVIIVKEKTIVDEMSEETSASEENVIVKTRKFLDPPDYSKEFFKNKTP